MFIGQETRSSIKSLFRLGFPLNESFKIMLGRSNRVSVIVADGTTTFLPHQRRKYTELVIRFSRICVHITGRFNSIRSIQFTYCYTVIHGSYYLKRFI